MTDREGVEPGVGWSALKIRTADLFRVKEEQRSRAGLVAQPACPGIATLSWSWRRSLRRREERMRDTGSGITIALDNVADDPVLSAGGLAARSFGRRKVAAWPYG